MLLLYIDRTLTASCDVLSTLSISQDLAKYNVAGHCSLGPLNFGTFSMYSFSEAIMCLGKQSIFPTASDTIVTGEMGISFTRQEATVPRAGA